MATNAALTSFVLWLRCEGAVGNRGRGVYGDLVLRRPSVLTVSRQLAPSWQPVDDWRPEAAAGGGGAPRGRPASGGQVEAEVISVTEGGVTWLQ
jgi:hypothetical protein